MNVYHLPCWTWGGGRNVHASFLNLTRPDDGAAFGVYKMDHFMVLRYILCNSLISITISKDLSNIFSSEPNILLIIKKWSQFDIHLFIGILFFNHTYHIYRLHKYYHTDQKYDKYDRLKSMLGLSCRFSALDLGRRFDTPNKTVLFVDPLIWRGNTLDSLDPFRVRWQFTHSPPLPPPF